MCMSNFTSKFSADWNYKTLPTLSIMIWTTKSRPGGKLVQHLRCQVSCFLVVLSGNAPHCSFLYNKKGSTVCLMFARHFLIGPSVRWGTDSGGESLGYSSVRFPNVFWKAWKIHINMCINSINLHCPLILFMYILWLFFKKKSIRPDSFIGLHWSDSTTERDAVQHK